MSYLSHFIPIITIPLICSLFISCQQEPVLYKKEFSAEEKKQLADQMTNNLIQKFGQGSVSEVLVLEEALRLQPENGDLWREIGIPYGKRGMAAEFGENYGKSVQYDPLSWQGWRGYMYLYFYRDYERAIADFNAIDDLTPDIVDYPQSTSVHFMRGICYLQLGEYDKALSYWDRHITEELKTNTEKYIDSKTFLFQGITYYKKGDYAKARESFDRGLKHADYNADLWLWSAKLALYNKEKKKGLADLEKAQIQYNKEYQNDRPYVEEFYQMHQADIDEVKEALLFLD